MNKILRFFFAVHRVQLGRKVWGAAAVPTTAVPTTGVPTTAPDPHLRAKSAPDSTY